MKKIRLLNYANGRITIRKRSLIHTVVFLVAFWSFLYKPISNLPGPLGYLKYLADGIVLLVLVLPLSNSRFCIRKDISLPLLTAVCFFLYAFVVYLFQYQSVAYFLWGFRNNFRFFIAFFAFAEYLDEADIESWFAILDVLFWINAVLSVFQFLFLRAMGDFLGGIFGTAGSSNGYTLILFSIVITKSILCAFSGTESFTSCLFKCAASLLVAAMAEMKFYYFSFILILLGAAALTRFSGKKLILILSAVAAIMLGAILLSSWFDSADFFNLSSLWENATKANYSSQKDINRLSAIPTLAKNIVTDPMKRLFGMGLGNCDTSSFAICNTPFYITYRYLHYTWFTSAMLFMETGYIGLAIYFFFFIVCFVFAYKRYKNGTGILLYSQMVMILSTMCVILTFYNSSLRIESGYMMYFVLALPFVRQSSGNNKSFQRKNSIG